MIPYAKTDINAQIKRMEEKHGKEVVLRALEEYLKENSRHEKRRAVLD